MQGRPAAAVPAVWIYPPIEEDPAGLVQLEAAGHVERQLVGLAVGLVHVGAAVEEDVQGPQVAEHHRQVERCVAA